MTEPAPTPKRPGDQAAFLWTLAAASTATGLILASVPVAVVFYALAAFAAVAAVAFAIKTLDEPSGPPIVVIDPEALKRAAVEFDAGGED